MSLTMFGQPEKVTALDFDVTGFKVIKEGVPEIGGVVEILDIREAFTLQFNFKGTGSEWENLCDSEVLTYNIHFDAEGIGPYPHNEYHLGEASGSLKKNQYKYAKNHTVVNGIPNTGVYRLSAMITFKDKDSGTPWKGMLGFAEGLVIQVHPFEE